MSMMSGHLAKPFWVLRPVCINRYAFGFKRTMDHLRTWPVVLPESVRRAEVSLSRRQERDPLSPHHGSWSVVHVTMKLTGRLLCTYRFYACSVRVEFEHTLLGFLQGKTNSIIYVNFSHFIPFWKLLGSSPLYGPSDPKLREHMKLRACTTTLGVRIMDLIQLLYICLRIFDLVFYNFLCELLL